MKVSGWIQYKFKNQDTPNAITDDSDNDDSLTSSRLYFASLLGNVFAE